MRLLVSVRSSAEVEAALSGGADIIDAKEPSHGSLGAVPLPVLADIMQRVPPDVELSVALGDVLEVDGVRQTIGRLPAPQPRTTTFVKLGFAGIPSAERAGMLLEAAVAAAREHRLNPRVIAVAYADADSAGSPPAEALVAIAARTGVAGLLVDTWGKNGRTLLDVAGLEPLTALVHRARVSGLLTALAGALRPHDLRFLRRAAPDVVGFRGAACDNGRSGTVSAVRVNSLRGAMLGLDSGFVQAAELPIPG